MLLYKGWLETRLRMLFPLGFMGLLLVFLYSVRNIVPAAGVRHPVFGIVMFSNPSSLVVACSMLAGTGIATQAAFQAGKGLHGSTFFTLSLPVSRFRLLAVRAGLGWLETAGLIGLFSVGMWFASPLLRATASKFEMFEYAETIIACSSALYFVSVLLATFLDDQWRIWGTMITAAVLWWLPSHTPLPASADIFRAMGEGSPLMAHIVPWPTMAVSLGLCAILFLAAMKVVQTREY